MTLTCQCGRSERHEAWCLIAQAFRYRCPDCKTRKRDGHVRHTSRCPLKHINYP